MKTIRAKIMVVDDDPDFREAMSVILNAASYEVVTAADATEGKRKILSERPDLILLDIMMDSLFDGYSLCHALKTSKEFECVRAIPVIFVSAVRNIAGSRFGFIGEDQGMTGPDDYIDKPVRPADLLARIDRFLKK
jgi:DNA-binding response OmpR family regulator